MYKNILAEPVLGWSVILNSVFSVLTASFFSESLINKNKYACREAYGVWLGLKKFKSGNFYYSGYWTIRIIVGVKIFRVSRN